MNCTLCLPTRYVLIKAKNLGSQFPAKIHASSNFRNTYVDVYYICRMFLISVEGYGFSVFPFVITCILHPRYHVPVLFSASLKKKKAPLFWPKLRLQKLVQASKPPSDISTSDKNQERKSLYIFVSLVFLHGFIACTSSRNKKSSTFR